MNTLPLKREAEGRPLPYKTDGLSPYIKEKRAWLAPMAGVTDGVFRSICKEMGAGLTCTEMVSAKGLHYMGAGSKALLWISDEEDQAMVQLFGRDPGIVAEQVALIQEVSGNRLVGFDINMGCPAPKITRNGEGSALMKEPEQAQLVAAAAVRASGGLPITVKFRKGWDDGNVNAVEFALRMQDAGVSAITVHGRTREQFYSGKADWDILRAVAEAVCIPVIGNGDIFSAQDAIDMVAQTGVAGVMVARGAQGNPWIFQQIVALWQKGIQLPAPSMVERLDVALRHARGVVALRGDRAVVEMRKHVAWYISGAPGAAAVRGKVNGVSNLAALEDLLCAYRESLEGGADE